MDTVYLTSVGSEYQGTILQDALQNIGIESLVKNELVSRMFGNASGFQLEVYVLEEDYEKAKEFLTESFPALVE